VRLLALPPLPLDLLTALFGDPRLEVFAPSERTQEAVDEALQTADLVLADWSPQTRLNDPGPRVVLVQQPGAGVDGIDVEACTARGVVVANTAGANAISVAEWCVSATFALLRKTVDADAAVRRGDWPQTSLGGRELAGLTVGVVGMGVIGAKAAALFQALGCGTSYWSRSVHADAPVPYQDLDTLLTTSDVVVLVIALSEQTRHLIDARRMKPGALLVNGARGGVVDEVALLEALNAGHVTAALDVFPVEPLPADSPLLAAPGVVLSPHMAGSTNDAATRIVAAAKANLARVLDGVPVIDVVNDLPALITPR
jgi:phosphoglycerate dehydrogenase-like enzyme